VLKELKEQLKDSLEELHVDYIDCAFLDSCDFVDRTFHLKNTLKGLRALTSFKADGKVRAIGICNVSREILTEIIEAGVDIKVVQNVPRPL
jgi:diketogulonate reductase-like aldo/keto reductase